MNAAEMGKAFLYSLDIGAGWRDLRVGDVVFRVLEKVMREGGGRRICKLMVRSATMLCT